MILKVPLLYPRIFLSCSIRLCGACDFSRWDHRLITAYNQQVHHFLVILQRIEEESQRRFLLCILRPQQVCLGGRIDGSCVCACSCLPLSPWGASPLFPHRVPEVRLRSRSEGPGLCGPCKLGRGRGAGRVREAQLQTKLVTPNGVRPESEDCWAAASSSLAHGHVHLLLFRGGFQVFL